VHNWGGGHADWGSGSHYESKLQKIDVRSVVIQVAESKVSFLRD
jgi:hypothetical protein